MGAQLDRDRRLARVAARQHGVVSRRQLVALGFGRGAIATRVEHGRLLRLHRGVYAVGHTALRPQGRWLAAVLACGEGAALSHATAAHVWDLRRSASAKVDVTIASTAGRSAPRGIRLHRHAALRPAEVTTAGVLPLTTVARTLLDLAATLTRRGLERALDQAEALRVFDLTALQAVADGRPGSVALRAALEEHRAGTTLTLSELEEALIEVCDAHGLRRPAINVPLHGYVADALFAAERLVVEADGFAHHGTRRAFEHDRRRDARLVAAGYRVMRITERRLKREPDAIARDLLSALRAP